jgi:vacuolar-type H+-ATPase subunit E/Vma4
MASVSKSEKYSSILKNLIIEGLVKIEESIVEIYAREEDKAMIAKLLPDAVTEFIEKMKDSGHNVTPTVTIGANAIPSKSM